VGVEGVNLLAPGEPYVCVGHHQDLEQEIEEAFCRAHGIPVSRRQVGGGQSTWMATRSFIRSSCARKTRWRRETRRRSTVECCSLLRTHTRIWECRHGIDPSTMSSRKKHARSLARARPR
jgi:hypothetical protein